MKRAREENSHDTSTSSTRFHHGKGINLPLDLVVEILKKLPTKSLLRFLCVSKLWSSIISRSRYFIDSIVTRSLTDPPRDAHIIDDHAARYYKECFLAFSSITCPRNTDEAIKLVMPERLGVGQYIRGLICCYSYLFNKAAIYNPTTRQCFNLPELKSIGTCFFGYDPLGNQYKALYIPFGCMEQFVQVFTLGDPKGTQWRNIQGVKLHFPMASFTCMNGVIYYVARNIKVDATSEYMLMSFDVRSEKFYEVEAPKTLMDHYSILINYQGKLGFVCCKKGMEIWVMEKANKETKQGWSMIYFYEMVGFENWLIKGANRGGEIVFVLPCYLSKNMLWVFYYDPKQNSMRYVHLKCTYPERQIGNMTFTIWSALDYVENTMCLYQAIS